MMLEEVGALKAYILNGTPAAAAAAVVVEVGDEAGKNGISGSSSSYGATPATGDANGINGINGINGSSSSMSPMDIVQTEQPQATATVLKEEDEAESEEQAAAAAATGNNNSNNNNNKMFTTNMNSNSNNNNNNNSNNSNNENVNEGGVEWTDDMIRFLIESYDNVEQQLWDKNGERSKFKKKWDPIAQMMHDKFNREFSKQQCLSKYWKVRRECLDFDVVAGKISRGEPPWDEVVDKEALKPRYYSIWCDHVAGKISSSNHEQQQQQQPCGAAAGEGKGSIDELKSKKFKARKRRQERIKQKRNHKRDKKSSKEEMFSDCCEPGEDEEVDEEEAHVLEGNLGLASSGDGSGDPLREMQAILGTHLEASAKREELMLGLLRQNIAHMSSREAAIEERQQAMGTLVARMNATCEKLLEAVSSLSSAHHHHHLQQHQQHPF